MGEELKQRLRDMGTLSDSRTPQDALDYIEQLEYNTRQYALEALCHLGQAEEAYQALLELKEQMRDFVYGTTDT